MSSTDLSRREALGPILMFSKRDKHYQSRSRQPSLATAVTNSPNLFQRLISGPVQTIHGFSLILYGGSTTGFVNFVLAVAYQLLPSLRAAFVQPGTAFYVRALLKMLAPSFALIRTK